MIHPIITNRITTIPIMGGIRRVHLISAGAEAFMEVAGAAAVGMAADMVVATAAGAAAVDMVADTAEQSSAGSSRRLLVQGPGQPSAP
jgi:hypothetical protein